MNTKIQKRSIKAALIAAVLLVAGAFSGPANAQGQMQAKFTLPFEVNWGHAVLPPGDYLVEFPPETPGILVIRDAKKLRVVAIENTYNREDSAGRRGALLISIKGREHVVYTLTVAELGETFIYHRVPERQAEEARNTLTIPVLVAQK